MRRARLELAADGLKARCSTVELPSQDESDCSTLRSKVKNKFFASLGCVSTSVEISAWIWESFFGT